MKIHLVKSKYGGKCDCGCRVKSGEVYVVVENITSILSRCVKCGEKVGLGEDMKGLRVISGEEMNNYWFGGKDIKEEICSHHTPSTKKSSNCTTRDALLAIAVDV
jgi:hypothetical protein